MVISQTKKQAELLQKNFNINSTTISNAHYIPELSGESKSSILWVGRAHPMKRPEVLLELAKSFKNEKFVMVMSSNKDYDYIYRDIKERSLVKQTILILSVVSGMMRLINFIERPRFLF